MPTPFLFSVVSLLISRKYNVVDLVYKVFSTSLKLFGKKCLDAQKKPKSLLCILVFLNDVLYTNKGGSKSKRETKISIKKLVLKEEKLC